MTRQRAVATMVLLSALALVTGCATNPVTGKSQFSLVSESQELAIGKDGYQAVLAEYGAYEDGRLGAYVDSVGKRLAAVSHQPNLEWHFTLLDDPTVNAFAMPGGYIYITRGILTHLTSEAQLAGVLGHEIGHVTARHTAQQITQQQIAGLGLGLASIVSPTVGRYSGAAQQALGLLFLKYSRDDETQADQLGVDYSTRAGYDPREIPTTYVMLRRVGEAAGQRIPAFMSTHPDPGDRENRTRELARAAATGKTGLVIKSRDFVRRTDGVVYGNDPRQGYFEGTRFIQPEIGFEITFPDGWKTQNSRSAVLAGAPDKSGVIQLTLADAKGATPSQYVAELLRAQRLASADGTNGTIGGYSAWEGRIGLLQKDGSVAPVTAAFIQRSATQMFQILGQTANGDGPVRNTIHSFRNASGTRSVTPARIKVITVAQTAPFSSVFSAAGPQAASVEEEAILNIVEPDESVAQGTLVKLVPKP